MITTMVERGRWRRRSGARWLHFVFVVLQFGLLLRLGVTTCKGAETINDDNVIPSLPDEINRDDQTFSSTILAPMKKSRVVQKIP